MAGLWQKTLIMIGILSLLDLSFQACPPFTVCTKRRDTIIQTDRFTNDEGNPKNAGRTWFIKMETVGNVLLHFKSFQDHGNSVAAFAYKDKTLSDARIFYRHAGGFQVLLEDCDLLVLYLPFFESPLPTFELEYFWGCGVMKNDQHVLNYMGGVNQKEHVCWFVEPDDKTAAIYLSAENIRLGNRQSLKVWDLASKEVLLEVVEGQQYYGLSAIEYNQSQPLIVELSCRDDGDNTASSCSVASSSFKIIHQAMRKSDMECLERYRCKESELENCSIRCPAFDELLYNHQLWQYRIDTSKSVPRTGMVRKPNPKPQCQLQRMYCNCPSNLKRAAFCNPKLICKVSFFKKKHLPLGCLWTCLYTKVMDCPKISRTKKTHVQIL